MSDYDDIIKLLNAGDVATLKAIAMNNGDFPNGRDDFVHRHWLINAIDCGNRDIVEWMLKEGVPANVDCDAAFPVLHSAIGREASDKYEIIELLIAAGADVNQRGLNGYTPVHYAASLNDIKSLEMLRNAGADLTKQTNVDDYATPLEEAVEFGWSEEVIHWLRTSTEQASSGQPATRRESKSEGGDKPQPEAVGRSR